jgi:hypothetical protein
MDDIFSILNGENTEGTFDLEKRDKRRNKVSVKDISIAPLFKDNDDYVESPHPNLLRMPFSLLEIAPKGSGKTVLLQNILTWYHKYFDNIFVFSPTIYLDTKWILLIEKLNIPKQNLFTKYEEKNVSMLMNKIKLANRGKKNKEKLRTLIIFDDIIEQLPKGKKISSLNKLAMNHRHFNISHIIISQSFKKIDPVVRSNTTGIILFNTDNSAERFKIIEEISGNYSKKEFEKLYLEAVKEKYNFLFINYDTRKIFRNFEEEIGDLNRKPEHLF